MIQISAEPVRNRMMRIRDSDAPIDQANRFGRWGVGTGRAFKDNNVPRIPVGLRGVRPNETAISMSKSRKIDRYSAVTDPGRNRWKTRAIPRRKFKMPALARTAGTLKFFLLNSLSKKALSAVDIEQVA